jgi:hypothetical protein
MIMKYFVACSLAAVSAESNLFLNEMSDEPDLNIN